MSLSSSSPKSSGAQVARSPTRWNWWFQINLGVSALLFIFKLKSWSGFSPTLLPVRSAVYHELVSLSPQHGLTCHPVEWAGPWALTRCSWCPLYLIGSSLWNQPFQILVRNVPFLGCSYFQQGISGKCEMTNFSYPQISMETEPLHHPIFVNSQQLDSGGNTISHESEIVFQLSCLALNICSLRIFPLIISNQVACFRKKKSDLECYPRNTFS